MGFWGFGGFNFDFGLDTALFQEGFGNADTLRVADFNETGADGVAHGFVGKDEVITL